LENCDFPLESLRYSPETTDATPQPRGLTGLLARWRKQRHRK
jgi:hypothetical protein